MGTMQLSRTDNCIDDQIALYGDMVYRIGILYLRNPQDAEDVFQEVFIKLFSAKTQFESPQHRKAWLITTTANQCKNVLRSVWYKRTVALDELCGAVEDQNTDEQSDLTRELLTLPLKYRRVLFLYYFEGYKCEEIGALLHISTATVRTQMKRGRELLKCRLLEGEIL